jgi:hypothetical protein
VGVHQLRRGPTLDLEMRLARALGEIDLLRQGRPQGWRELELLALDSTLDLQGFQWLLDDHRIRDRVPRSQSCVEGLIGTCQPAP